MNSEEINKEFTLREDGKILVKKEYSFFDLMYDEHPLSELIELLTGIDNSWEDATVEIDCYYDDAYKIVISGWITPDEDQQKRLDKAIVTKRKNELDKLSAIKAAEEALINTELEQLRKLREKYPNE